MPRVPVSDNVVPFQGPKIDPTMLAMAAAMMHQEGRFAELQKPKPDDSSDQQRR